jgi:hypothetical protein
LAIDDGNHVVTLEAALFVEFLVAKCRESTTLRVQPIRRGLQAVGRVVGQLAVEFVLAGTRAEDWIVLEASSMNASTAVCKAASSVTVVATAGLLSGVVCAASCLQPTVRARVMQDVSARIRSGRIGAVPAEWSASLCLWRALHNVAQQSLLKLSRSGIRSRNQHRSRCRGRAVLRHANSRRNA